MADIKPCPQCGGECITTEHTSGRKVVVCLKCKYGVEGNTIDEAVALHSLLHAAKHPAGVFEVRYDLRGQASCSAVDVVVNPGQSRRFLLVEVGK